MALLGGLLGLAAYPIAETRSLLGAPSVVLERVVYDSVFAVRGTIVGEVDPRIVIVGFDNETETALGGPWPPSRSVVADAVRKMAADGAAVIVLDMLFEHASDPVEDRALDAALREAGNVVLAVRFDRDDDPKVMRKALVGPYYDEALGIDFEAATRIGFTEVPVDEDGVARRYLPFVRFLDEPVPSLATAAAAEMQGVDAVRAGDGALSVGSLVVPLAGPSGIDPVDKTNLPTVEVRFPAGGLAFPSPCDLAQAAAGSFVPGTFRGKVVFVGVTGTQQAKELGDSRVMASTALSPERRGGAYRRDVPGVVLQAHYLNAITQNLWLRPVPPVGRFLFGASLALVFVGIARRLPDRRGVAGVVLAGTAALALQAGLMHWAGLFLPTAGVSVGGGGMALAVAWADRSRLRRRWASYVSPAVFQMIVDSDESVVQTRCRATVLFADLRGFTHFANQHPPEEVLDVLNRHFARLIPAIEAEGGTLDKFLGDGLLAVFGSPVAMDHSEQRAVRAALAMARICEAPIVDEKGRSWQFDVGFGLATGEVVAGLVGSSRRHDFTVIGDAVNQASRIQSLSQGGVVVDGATADALDDTFVVEFLEEVQLRGIEEPVRCFRVV